MIKMERVTKGKRKPVHEYKESAKKKRKRR